MAQTFTQVADAVGTILQQAGRDIRLAMPLGIGKPNVLANALYAALRNRTDSNLAIFTALSLLKPRASGELEQRFLEPLVERLYGNYPDLDYARDLQHRALPANVQVYEYFLKSGDWLGNAHAQQHYISSNYTDIARDMAGRQPNVLAQAVAARRCGGHWQFSLSCNPDVTLDLVKRLRNSRQPFIAVAAINHELPFMPGTSVVDEGFFDIVIDDPACTHTLFSTPNMKVGLADYAIGLHASSLVQDGGTLQIGIGSLGDAVAHSLLLRHQDNDNYRNILAAMHHQSGTHTTAMPGAFTEGLYGCSEMLVNGLLELMNAGVIRRTVTDPASGRAVALHGGFFLGPQSFYQKLRDMTPDQLAKIDMASISFINQLYGDSWVDEATKRQQRQKAAFINTCMMVTLTGAAVSDALEDGRVVSGVGGQYNFVAMANALEDASSILMLRSWRMNDGKPQSNIVTHYGHCTIPRHLRDIVITEYGIADLRGQDDASVIARLIAIADARFQQELCDAAKSTGKLPQHYEIPATVRQNTPEILAETLGKFRHALPDFPFGHDFTQDELAILNALQKIKAASDHPFELLKTVAAALLADHDVPERYLERMGFDESGSLREKLLRKVFAGNL